MNNKSDSGVRPIAVVGAPSSIGIRPYNNGEQRRLDLSPSVLRELGVVSRLSAEDFGDVLPSAYVDFVRAGKRPVNEVGVANYSRLLAERVAVAAAKDRFVVVAGGDCSIVLGCLLGFRRSRQGKIGLVYIDAHADFGAPEESRSGSASSMCLALAVGRGDTPLARLNGQMPLVEAADVVLIGRRDHGEPWYGHEALRSSDILDLTYDQVRKLGAAQASRTALERVTGNDMEGFWIHVDADVLDPTVMPAVDSPIPGGLELEELVSLITPMTRHPQALGLEITIYDPTFDRDRACGERLVSLLEKALKGHG